MSKTNPTKFFKTIQTALVEHSPEILTGMGIAGMITTTILAVRSTPKALALIEREKDRQNRELIAEAKKNGANVCPQVSKIKPAEAIKVAWKCYIPAAITGVASTACLIGASSVHLKRNALLATAYKLSETALTEYKEKVIETIGEKKEEVIRDKIYKDHIEKNPVSNNEVILTDNGDTLCYDHFSGRYFKSSIDKIEKAVNRVNKKILNEDYISLNDFYDELNLNYTELGSLVGWNTQMREVEVTFSAQLSENGTPCLVMDFVVPPKYKYDKYC